MSPLALFRPAAFLSAVLLSAGMAHANTFVVTSTADTDGNSCGPDCTLRQAINAANMNEGEDTIVFDEGAFAGKRTITLTNWNNSGAPHVGLPWISSSVTIVGSSKPGTGLTIDALNPLCNEVFRVSPSFTGVNMVNISNLNIKGGDVGFANMGAVVTLTGCTFSDHKIGVRNAGAQWVRLAQEGEAKDAMGTVLVKVEDSGLTLNNCTICDNSEQGISNYIGVTNLNSCTVTGNNVGIEGITGHVNLANALVVGNKKGDLWGYDNTNGSRTLLLKPHDYVAQACDFNKTGQNITSGTAADAGLDPNGLHDNGGPTPTIALLKSGSAVDKGETAIETDQRGVARTVGGKADIGAFEYQDGPMATPPDESPSI